MKKIVSMILVAMMIAAMFAFAPVGASAAAWDGTTATEFAGSGTNSDPYIIATAENLRYLQEQVAAGKDFGGKYITQTADIDLGGKEWTPIGTSSMQFCGVYDGLGHSINGLYISKGDINATGLFGYVSSNYLHEAGIMNLKVYGEINIPDLTLDNGIGAVVGWLYKDGTDGMKIQKLTNIENHVNITINANAKQPRLGGVIGYAFNSEITNVVNYGTITYVGSGNTRVGGIVGQTNRTHYLNCINNGDITVTVDGTVSAQAAGIAGMTTYKIDSQYADYDHCVNNGKITCVSADGACFAGGILAAIYSSGTNMFTKVHECVNNGAISAEMAGSVDGKYAYAAGIIPRISVSMIEIENCVNTTLDITSTGATGDFAAGIVSHITKDDAATILVKDNVTVTFDLVKESVGTVDGGIFAATDGQVANVLEPIMKAIPALLADATIDGFPGKADPTTAEQTTAAPEPSSEESTSAPAPTDETEVSSAPETSGATPEATTAPEKTEEKGCGSVAVGAAVVLTVILGAAVVSKKRS